MYLAATLLRTESRVANRAGEVQNLKAQLEAELPKYKAVMYISNGGVSSVFQSTIGKLLVFSSLLSCRGPIDHLFALFTLSLSPSMHQAMNWQISWMRAVQSSSFLLPQLLRNCLGVGMLWCAHSLVSNVCRVPVNVLTLDIQSF